MYYPVPESAQQPGYFWQDSCSRLQITRMATVLCQCWYWYLDCLHVFFLIKTPEDLGQKPLGWATDAGSAGNTADVPGVSYKDALKSSTFKFLVLGLLFTSFGGTVFLSYAPSWWQMNGMSATGAANWNAIYLLLAGGLLLVAGTISEKLGTKGFVFYVCVAYVLTFICMVVWPATGGAVYMMVLTVIFGAAAYPVNASIPSFVGTAAFGPREFGQISATLMIAVYIGQGNRFTDYGSYFTDSWRYGTWMENLCNSSGGWHGVPPGST